MKFVRFGEPGGERPGMIAGHGRLRHLSEPVEDILGSTMAPAELGGLVSRTGDQARLGIDALGVRLHDVVAFEAASHGAFK